LPVIFVIAQPFDESFYDFHDRIAMRLDIGLGAGEATAGVVEAELAHVDERIETEFFGGDILRWNERRALDDAFAQGCQPRRRTAHRDHPKIAIGDKAALSQ